MEASDRETNTVNRIALVALGILILGAGAPAQRKKLCKLAWRFFCPRVPTITYVAVPVGTRGEGVALRAALC